MNQLHHSITFGTSRKPLQQLDSWGIWHTQCRRQLAELPAENVPENWI